MHSSINKYGYLFINSIKPERGSWIRASGVTASSQNPASPHSSRLERLSSYTSPLFTFKEKPHKNLDSSFEPSLASLVFNQILSADGVFRIIKISFTLYLSLGSPTVRNNCSPSSVRFLEDSLSCQSEVSFFCLR